MTAPAPHRSLDKANLFLRVASALVFAALFLSLLFHGTAPWAKLSCLVVLLAAAFMGVRELCLMAAKAGHRPSLLAGTAVAWLFLLHFYAEGLNPAANPLPLWLALAAGLGIVHLGGLLLRKDPVEGALAGQAVTWMAGLVLGLGLGFIQRLFMFNQTSVSNTGGRLLFALFLVVWLGDTCAYFAGSLLGRHKLAPKVSPKKTWEGALGNLAGNLGAAFLARALVCTDWSVVDAAAIGLLLGTAGILGDLAESAWKRSVGVKDSAMGLEIPGHGGLLDRVDSLVFAAPALYAYVHFVHGLA